MTAPDSLPLHTLVEHNLTSASPDLLRAVVKTVATSPPGCSSAAGPSRT
ncbi:hypothetical protein ACIHFC_22575 [Streptomyces sp. NPDC052013]